MIKIQQMLKQNYTRKQIELIYNLIQNKKYEQVLHTYNISILPKNIVILIIKSLTTNYIQNFMNFEGMSILDSLLLHKDNLYLINKLLQIHKDIKINKKNSLKYLFHNLSMNIIETNYIQIFNVLLPYIQEPSKYLKAKNYYMDTILNYLKEQYNYRKDQKILKLINKMKNLIGE